jgi:hypothetical protein
LTRTDHAAGSLPPSATHERSWSLLPATGAEKHPRDWTLCIKLTSGRKRIRTEFHWYAVTEMEADGPVGRKFLLVKEGTDGVPVEGHAPIVCVVGGMVATCDCTSGYWDQRRVEPRRSCKHRDVLSQLLSEGLL